MSYKYLTFCVLAALSLSGSAFAEDSLKDDEEKLYGNHTGRVTLGGFFGSGSDVGVAVASTTPGAPAAGPANRDFTKNGGDIGFDWGFFGNQTMFKTHLGGEISTALGFRSGRTYSDGTQSDGGIAFRLDTAFTYGVLHGNIGLPARLTFLTGPGFKYDPDMVGAQSFAYLLLGLRGGVRVGENMDAHVQYIYIPGTGSSEYLIREHRIEGAIHYGPVGAGVRWDRQTITSNDEKLSLSAPKLGAFVGYVF